MAGADTHLALRHLARHGEPAPIARGRAPKAQTLKQWMARLLSTKPGAKVYSRRKVIAEPPIGQIKNRGFRQLLLRGRAKCAAEWALIVTSHNLLKLHAAT